MVYQQACFSETISGRKWSRSAWLLAMFAAAAVSAETVQVNNPAGDITIRSAMGSQETAVHVSVVGRRRHPGDVRLTRLPDRLLVECRPSDGAKVNLEIVVPHAAELQASTLSGDITASGLIRSAELTTETGNVSPSAPWSMMRLRVACRQRPKHLVKKSIGRPHLWSRKKDRFWMLADDFFPDLGKHFRVQPADQFSAFAHETFDRVFPRSSTYGEIRVLAGSPPRLELRDEPVPADSWVRSPRSALHILGALSGMGSKELGNGEPVSEPEAGAAFIGDRGAPLFVSNVRMVMLSTPVHDAGGRPLTGLQPGDFEVCEDGVPQEIASAGSEQLPFNLVLLLDMSGSTLPHRANMIDAAQRFVDMVRPRDRVAVYALADTLFQVISPLTEDHQRVKELMASLPATGGDTPLYDAIVMAYAQESLAALPDRTALVVISDGLDLALAYRSLARASGSLDPLYDDESLLPGSMVPFERLRRAVSRMPVLIYPILLPATEQRTAAQRHMASVAARNMRKLAEASGGRLFRADSLEALDPAYSLVARELRGVYAISYYPRNQNFDGRWRQVEIRLRRSGTVLRTRAGYSAR